MLNLDRVRKIKKGEYGLTTPQLQYNYTTSSFEQSQNWKDRLNNQFFLDATNQPNPYMNGNSVAQFLKSPQGLNLMSNGVDMLNNTFFSNKDSYDTKYGGLTQVGDQLINKATNFVSSINPAVGLALKGANFAGNILGKMGGSTDGMTRADAILNTGMGSFLTLGLNGFLGKRTRDFAIDNQTRERAGNSYVGSYNDIDEAASLANKKFGFVSEKARRKAEGKINYADSIQDTITGITDNAYERQLLTSNMSQLNNLRYNTNQNGGIDQRYLISAKQGDKIQRIKKLQLHKVGGVIKQSINVNTKQIEEWSPAITECFEEGGTIEWKPTIEILQEGGEMIPKITFESWYNTIPENKKDTTNYNLRRAFELAPQEELIKFVKDPESHLRTFYYNSDGIGEFMKSKNHPTLWMELEYYNNGNNVINKNGKNIIVPADKKEWEEFRKNYTLDTSGEYYKYVPNKFKNGGKTEELESPKIEETNQKNIIPEGALHAHKHHMENADNLTKKGIPVIDNEGEQQAEIEKNEIIFTLEVTKKLEELMKDGSDDAAIEAGKLLVKEILFNTEDRTGLIGTLGKGGVIDVVS